MRLHSATPLTIALLSAAVAAQATPRAALEQRAFDAMTFNIRYGTADDGENRWERRAHLVARTIRDRAPDLVGLQEALDFQVSQLAVALPEYEVFGIGRGADGSGERCSLLVRADRFAVERHGTFWLSPTPNEPGSRGWDAALPRIGSWAVLRDRVQHARLVWCNTHFDHRGGMARTESARVIARWLREQHPELPWLVTGDLNAGEKSTPLRVLREAGLRDSFRVLHPDATRVGTFSGFRGRDRGQKIDYVLCSDAFEVHGAAIDKTMFDGRNASDHFAVDARLSLPAGEPPKLVPVLDGAMWRIGDNPDLGALTGTKQQAVDHAVFRATDGRWQLWSCIRGTAVGRVLHAWQGDRLTQPHWQPRGVVMRADPRFGESIDDWGGKEWIQAPHVVAHDGRLAMLYGGHRSELEHCQICLATSTDGIAFERHRNELGQSRVFVGPGEARDPMLLRVGDQWLCYYTGNPDPHNRRDGGRIYCRTSIDLVRWSAPKVVNRGGRAGAGMWSAECPHVVFREGYYYLFRTNRYAPPLTYVYRSADPFDFGRGDDAKLVATIHVSAPEIATEDGRDYVTSVHDLRRGIHIGRLRWVPERDAPQSTAFAGDFAALFDFESGKLDAGWVFEGDAFAGQPVRSQRGRRGSRWFGARGGWLIASAEAADANAKPNDRTTGILRSPAFALPAGRIAFLIGGGDDRQRCHVALRLENDGAELQRATGRGTDAMHRVVWDVGAHAGQAARLEIVDRSTERWGRVSIDDVRVERKP